MVLPFWVRDNLVNLSPETSLFQSAMNAIFQDTADKLGITKEYALEITQHPRTDKLRELASELDVVVAERLKHWLKASNEALAKANEKENSYAITE
jgi:hypothetical protein